MTTANTSSSLSSKCGNRVGRTRQTSSNCRRSASQLRTLPSVRYQLPHMYSSCIPIPVGGISARLDSTRKHMSSNWPRPDEISSMAPVHHNALRSRNPANAASTRSNVRSISHRRVIEAVRNGRPTLTKSPAGSEQEASRPVPSDSLVKCAATELTFRHLSIRPTAKSSMGLICSTQLAAMNIACANEPIESATTCQT